ncbi:hypothetical protein INP83_00920 [Mucilaginibacter sp. 21P]|uniref:hypothetical protein n=1 Tax=Mucilaginibacter sp. 21P TaxID=2778902 RepID=UPI001C5A43A6|nr:hypothetical protein [Mucilaginibacter sp. 21P]QXV65689.1 hypothetical protein INP83_00920 [Mucilaginibacter sp. 21P]
MQPKIELAKTRDFGEIINDTFTFIKQNFKDLVKNLYLFCGVVYFAGAALIAMQQYQMVNAASSFGQEGPATYNSFDKLNLFGVKYFAGMGLMIIGSALSVLSIIGYMALYKQKGNIKPTSAEVWGYMKYYFGRTILATLVITVLLIIGFALCIIPGIYLFPIFGIIFPIMIMENGSFGYSFNRSFQLIRNNWWLTAGAILVSWIIMYFIVMAISLPAAFLGISATLLRPTTALNNFGIITPIVTVALQMISLVCYIVPMVTLGLCYYNLSESKEGTSLLERINNLGTNSNNDNLPAEEY